MKKRLVIKIMLSIIYFFIVFISCIYNKNIDVNNSLKLVTVVIIVNLIVSTYNYYKYQSEKKRMG